MHKSHRSAKRSVVPNCALKTMAVSRASLATTQPFPVERNSERLLFVVDCGEQQVIPGACGG